MTNHLGHEEQPSENRRNAPLGREHFEEIYRKSAPWDIGKPQPQFVRLEEQGCFKSPLLDIGCGTGELALFLASRGYRATGIDFVPGAIAKAKSKAQDRDLEVDFYVHDALTLPQMGKRYACILDCGLFHTFSDDNRIDYVAGLSQILEPSGKVFVMCFSEEEDREGGPRRVTQAEIRHAFGEGWNIHSIQSAKFEASIFEGGARAWLAQIEKV